MLYTYAFYHIPIFTQCDVFCGINSLYTKRVPNVVRLSSVLCIVARSFPAPPPSTVYKSFCFFPSYSVSKLRLCPPSLLLFPVVPSPPPPKSTDKLCASIVSSTSLFLFFQFLSRLWHRLYHEIRNTCTLGLLCYSPIQSCGFLCLLMIMGGRAVVRACSATPHSRWEVSLFWRPLPSPA